jgi:hypothetical protein
MSEKKMNRYSIQLSDRFDKFLTELSHRDGISKADTIRRSVAFYSYMRKELDKGHRVLKIVDEEKGSEVIFVTDVLFPENIGNANPRKRRSSVRASLLVGSGA